MSLFEQKFRVVIEADETPVTPAPEAAPDSDKAAMAQTLTSAKPEDFDVQGGREKIVDHRKQMEEREK
jgi:hypothetical protein